MFSGANKKTYNIYRSNKTDMKATKYPQSCILVETNNKKILIDPGTYVYEQTDMKPEDWKNIDFLLLTHRHGDHCHPESIKTIKENNPEMIILSNSKVKEKLEDIESEVVKEGDIKEFGDIKIEVVKAIHGCCPAVGGPAGIIKENNGFIIDDGKLRTYHCGDTLVFYPEFKADVIFVPICGHGVVMEPDIAVDFCKLFNPKLVIPVHYDSEKHPMGTDKFEEEIKKTDMKYKILKNKESIEI